jgi:hypothetical protein
MNRWTKAGLVGAGYLLAFAAGGVAGHLYNVRVSALPYDTSGGMYAGGELMAALSAFLVVALLPTLLALWFLRGSAKLWQTVALAALVFAGAGLLAVLMPLVTHNLTRNPALLLFSLLGLAQLLGMPLWTAAFALFAFLAPTRSARRLLIAAISLELVIGVCAAIHWFVPRPPL